MWCPGLSSAFCLLFLLGVLGVCAWLCLLLHPLAAAWRRRVAAWGIITPAEGGWLGEGAGSQSRTPERFTHGGAGSSGLALDLVPFFAAAFDSPSPPPPSDGQREVEVCFYVYYRRRRGVVGEV